METFRINNTNIFNMAKDGYSEYSIHSIEDDKEFEKSKARLKLMTELVKGLRSGEEEGWLSEEDVDKHFAEKRLKCLS